MSPLWPVLTGFIGLVVGDLYRYTKGRSSVLRGQRRFASRDRVDGSVPQKAVERFEALGWQDRLYKTSSFTDPVTVPMVFDRNLSVSGLVDLYVDTFVHVDNAEVDTFEINRRLMEAREKTSNIWNGQVVYVKDMNVNGVNSGVIVAGICNFYSYVTRSNLLEKAILGRGKAGSSLLESDYRSMSAVRASTSRPIVVAGVTACVFNTDEGLLVAMHRRSNEVMSSRGTYGILPTFAVESNVSESGRSRYSILFYNFVKEFLEEIYGLEKVIKAASESHFHPDWLFTLPNAANLLDEFESGRAYLRVLGSGADPTDGTFNYFMVAHFSSITFLSNLDTVAQGNWETAAVDNGQRPIEFRSLFGGQLSKAAQLSTMNGPSLVVLDLARQYLAP